MENYRKEMMKYKMKFGQLRKGRTMRIYPPGVSKQSAA
jgi:hypothetical protein